MRRLCNEALLAAADAGAEYADVRVIDARWRSVRTYAGALAGVDRGQGLGMGVRARVQGAWGFASATELSVSAARVLAQRAVQLAEVSRLLLSEPTALAPARVVEAEIDTPVAIDPFEVSIDEQRDLLLATETALRGAPAVRAMAGRIACSRQLAWLATTEGTFVVQNRVVTGAGYRAVAETPEGRAVRSWPQAYGGQFGTGGWEIVEALDLIGSAVPLSDDITNLIHAEPCPEGVVDLVLSGPASARLLHDTLVRCFESDRLVETGIGRGGVYVTPGEVGTRRLAGSAVTVVNDPGLPGGLGSYAIDDEGSQAARHLLVDEGVWVGVLANRETARAFGSAAATGSARADGFNRAPLVRAGNLALVGGNGSLGDLLDGVESGLLVDTPVRLAVDPAGRRFVCEFEVGWTVRRGRRWAMVQRPTIVADTEDFWRRCDAVAAPDGAVWSVEEAARGVPLQRVGIGVAAPPARFRGIAAAPSERA